VSEVFGEEKETLKKDPADGLKRSVRFGVFGAENRFDLNLHSPLLSIICTYARNVLQMRREVKRLRGWIS
jgi:hypothetical protein